MTFSKSEVNRLGERLRAGPPTTLDLELLNDFRRTFAPSFAAVEAAVRELVRGEVSGRPSKTTPSIVAKLRRGTLQLSRMQDIAGIRIVGPDVEWQDETMRALTVRWPESRLVDRRLKPTHGYRAVHVIPSLGQLPVEIQVRTRLQHLWAQVSERGADLAGWDLKYGEVRPLLSQHCSACLTSSLVLNRRRWPTIPIFRKPDAALNWNFLTSCAMFR